MADQPLLENSNFRFILIDAYSQNSGTPGGRDQVADLLLLENSNFRFILIDVYPESSFRPLGIPSARYTPPGKQ